MNPSVEGYEAAVLGRAPGGDLAPLAEELAAVARLVAANADLHAALTDTSLPGASRRAVLLDLLGSRVRPPVARIAAFTASAVHAQEVPSALGWVAHRARQLADGTGGEAGRLSPTETRARIGGFAAALFEDVDVDQLSEIEDELFRFARIVDSTPPLRELLGDRDAPVAVRQGVIEDLIGGKVQEATGRLVAYVVSAGRARDFVGTIDWLVGETARARGWRVARVRTGQALDEQERSQLSTTLSRLAGAPVDLQVTLDPALLAGVRVEIGDLQVDGTVRGRLDRLREHMTSAAWTDQGFGRLAGTTGANRAGPGAGASEDGEGARNG